MSYLDHGKRICEILRELAPLTDRRNELQAQLWWLAVDRLPPDPGLEREFEELQKKIKQLGEELKTVHRAYWEALNQQ